MGEEAKTYLKFPASFPNSVNAPLEKSSPETKNYNCISWALNDVTNWREPGDASSWQVQVVPEEEDLASVVAFFETSGFRECETGKSEAGFDKIALYANDSKDFQHVARLLPSGKWTSKLGGSFDVIHTLEALEDGIYGKVQCFMKRQRN